MTSGPHEHAERTTLNDALARVEQFIGRRYFGHLDSCPDCNALDALERIRAALAELEQARADLRIYEEWKRIANAHPGFLARDSMGMAERAALARSAASNKETE